MPNNRQLMTIDPSGKGEKEKLEVEVHGWKTPADGTRLCTI